MVIRYDPSACEHMLRLSVLPRFGDRFAKLEGSFMLVMLDCMINKVRTSGDLGKSLVGR